MGHQDTHWHDARTIIAHMKRALMVKQFRLCVNSPTLLVVCAICVSVVLRARCFSDGNIDIR